MIRFHNTELYVVPVTPAWVGEETPGDLSLPLEKGAAQSLSEHVQGGRFMLPSAGEQLYRNFFLNKGTRT